MDPELLRFVDVAAPPQRTCCWKEILLSDLVLLRLRGKYKCRKIIHRNRHIF